MRPVFTTLRITLMIATGVFVSFGLFTFVSGYVLEPRLDLDPPLDTKENVEYWRMRIREIGAPAAHKEFIRTLTEKKNLVLGFTLSRQHTVAHTFGTALYQELGLDGITVCDDSFTYGCLHTFFGHAVEDNSINIVQQFDERCENIGGVKETNCQHGLGHGILGYFGYDDVSLNQALEICRSIGNAGVMGGCYGGVFMEYNLHILWFEDTALRAVDDRGFVGPCRESPEYATAACFARLPQWWSHLLSAEGKEDYFDTLGEYCHRYATNTREFIPCATGLGYQFSVELDQNTDAVIAACTTAFPDTVGLAWCTTGAIRRLHDAEMPFKASYCAHLPPEAREPCRITGEEDTAAWHAYDREVLGL